MSGSDTLAQSSMSEEMFPMSGVEIVLCLLPQRLQLQDFICLHVRLYGMQSD